VVEIQDATPADAAELAANLRDADRQEVWAYGFDDPLPAVTESITNAAWSKVARVDGALACVFGLAKSGTVLTRVGHPWMLGTPVIDRNARALMLLSRPYIAKMLRECPHLVNVVHAPNTRAVRWLRRAGFALADSRPMGPRRELFHPFEMRA
jgi:hypothetical protein